MYSVLNKLSEHIHFYMSKTLLHTPLLLVFKLIDSLQCILKLEIRTIIFRYFRNIFETLGNTCDRVFLIKQPMAKSYIEKTNWLFEVHLRSSYIFRVINLLNKIQDKISNFMEQTISLGAIYTLEKEFLPQSCRRANKVKLSKN